MSADTFVGRQSECRALWSRIFESTEAASVAIVGPPRVGKSSLARKVCEDRTGTRNQRGQVFVPVWVTVSGLTTEQSLFRELANTVHNALADIDGVSPRLESALDRLLATSEWEDMRMKIGDYFKIVDRLDYQVVAVLDEFDAARNIFSRSAPFELLRILAYEPDKHVSLITTSRRDLTEIVVRSSAEISNFPQIFGLPVTLGLFDDTEMAQLIARSPHADPDFGSAIQQWLSTETGGQPYVASAMLCVLHDMLPDTVDDQTIRTLDEPLARTVQATGELVVNHYEQLLELLRQEGRLQLLLEVLFGPQLRATPLDAERFEKEGIVRRDGERWKAYSENFQEYLGLLERRVDDWPLWQKTEIGLRSMLRSALRDAYGESWVSVVEDSQRRIVQKCAARREHNRAFGELARDDDFIEYSYPKELLEIMMRHWIAISDHVGETRASWEEAIEVVARMRTPMAHNRQGATSPTAMEEFRSCCRRLLGWVERAGESVRPDHESGRGSQGGRPDRSA